MSQPKPVDEDDNEGHEEYKSYGGYGTYGGSLGRPISLWYVRMVGVCTAVSANMCFVCDPYPSTMPHM